MTQFNIKIDKQFNNNKNKFNKIQKTRVSYVKNLFIHKINKILSNQNLYIYIKKIKMTRNINIDLHQVFKIINI
jgi:hypothetical protein